MAEVTLTVPDFSAEKAVQIYLPLMHELAFRIELVADACQGKLNLTPAYALEYSYFQFRRICELMALGCLQLHGDLPETKTKSATKEWHAENIMRLLQRSFPHAFPQPVSRHKTSEGWSIEANSKPNALTREEFHTLYAKCGEVLHRGTIRTLQSAGTFTESDYEQVIAWQKKIVELMNEHLIARANQKSFYVISLRTPSGFPECSIFSINSAGQFDVNIQKMTIN